MSAFKERGGDGEEEVGRRHDAAVAAGEAGYIDPDSGLFVLTAAYLLERGECCGSGCRHCPYGDDDPRETIDAAEL